MFSKIGFTEILVLLIVALLVFGPSKLPEIGKALGRGIREFKAASKELKDSLLEEEKETEEKKA